jgi:hypothetical protein
MKDQAKTLTLVLTISCVAAFGYWELIAAANQGLVTLTRGFHTAS